MVMLPSELGHRDVNKGKPPSLKDLEPTFCKWPWRNRQQGDSKDVCARHLEWAFIGRLGTRPGLLQSRAKIHARVLTVWSDGWLHYITQVKSSQQAPHH